MNALRYITIMSAILAFSIADAQKIKTYKAWVTLTNENKVTGILYSADKDGIVLMDKDLTDTTAFVDYKTIKVLKIRRKGSVGKGAWVGAVSGMVIGGVAGYASGDDDLSGWLFSSTAEEKILEAGIPAAIAGTGIGMLVGTNRKKYLIEGNHKKYATYLPELKDYALNQLKHLSYEKD